MASVRLSFFHLLCQMCFPGQFKLHSPSHSPDLPTIHFPLCMRLQYNSLSAGPPLVYVCIVCICAFVCLCVPGEVVCGCVCLASDAILHDWLAFISPLYVIYLSLSLSALASICVFAITHMSVHVCVCVCACVLVMQGDHRPSKRPCAPLQTLQALILNVCVGVFEHMLVCLCLSRHVCSPFTWVTEVVCCVFAAHSLCVRPYCM